MHTIALRLKDHRISSEMTHSENAIIKDGVTMIDDGRLQQDVDKTRRRIFTEPPDHPTNAVFFSSMFWFCLERKKDSTSTSHVLKVP